MSAWSALAPGAAPLRVVLLVLDQGGLTLAGLLTPLRLLQQQVGSARFTVTAHMLMESELALPELAAMR